MADDITLNTGSGGDTLGADDIGGVKYQIVKAGLGALDSLTLLDGNSGNKSAGTVRVVLATDQPALTNKLLVTPDLPTGASTAAKQPALGTAGTASADVISVQGIASMTALVVDGSGVTQPVSGTVAVTNAGLTELAGAINGSAQMDVNIAASAATLTVASHAVTNAGTFATQVDGAALTALQLIDDPVATLGTTTYTEAATKGMIVGAVRRDADTTLVDTTNEVGPLQMDANGRLKVEAFSGETLPVSLTSTTVTGTVAVTQSGTWDEVGINDSGNSITVDYATTGSGTANGALRVELPTNGTGTVGLNAGTNSIGKLAANSGVDIGDVDVTSISAGTNTIGNVGVIPRTSGGMTIFNSIDLDETEEEIKGTAGQIFSITAFNTTAAPLWLRFYNATAANTTVGTTATFMGPFLVPGNADSDGAGFVWNNEIGAAFSTAISAACTTGVASSDTGAPGSNACVVIVGYA